MTFQNSLFSAHFDDFRRSSSFKNRIVRGGIGRYGDALRRNRPLWRRSAAESAAGCSQSAGEFVGDSLRQPNDLRRRRRRPLTERRPFAHQSPPFVLSTRAISDDCTSKDSCSPSRDMAPSRTGRAPRGLRGCARNAQFRIADGLDHGRAHRTRLPWSTAGKVEPIARRRGPLAGTGHVGG